MSFPVRLEWSTASVGSSHAPTDAVDHSAPSAIRPESTYISGKVVQTNGATSVNGRPRQFCVMYENRRCSTLFHFRFLSGICG